VSEAGTESWAGGGRGGRACAKGFYLSPHAPPREELEAALGVADVVAPDEEGNERAEAPPEDLTEDGPIGLGSTLRLLRGRAGPDGDPEAVALDVPHGLEEPPEVGRGGGAVCVRKEDVAAARAEDALADGAAFAVVAAEGEEADGAGAALVDVLGLHDLLRAVRGGAPVVDDDDLPREGAGAEGRRERVRGEG
jgi:hypothetical protein